LQALAVFLRIVVLGTLENIEKPFAMEIFPEREATLPKARIFVAMEDRF
jgi:hypothetical protein